MYYGNTMHLSKVTTKGQATIPQAIRLQLGIAPGDVIGFVATEGGSVLLTRLSPEEYAHYRLIDQTMTEWSSPEDEAHFKHW